MAWRDVDLGAVSAYAVAVANGYKGTAEEWAQDQANAGENAGIARTAADEAVKAAVEAKEALESIETGTAAALEDIGAAGAAQIGKIADEGNLQAELVRDAGAEQSAGLTAQGEVERRKIAAEGDAQVGRVTEAGNTIIGEAESSINAAEEAAIAELNAHTNDAVNAIDDKGKSVMESIPQDYVEALENINEDSERLAKEIGTVSDKVIGASNYTADCKLLVDGSVVSAEGFCVSDKIQVDGFANVVFRVADPEASELLYLIEYGADNAKVDYYGTTSSRPFKLNANTAYVRFTFVEGYNGELYDADNGNAVIYSTVKEPDLDERVEAAETAVDNARKDITSIFSFAPNLLCDFCYPRETEIEFFAKSMVLNNNEQAFGDYSVRRSGDKFTFGSNEAGRKKYEHFVFNADMTKAVSAEFEIYYKYNNPSTKRVLVIGDSTIAGGQVVTAMRDAYGANMTLIGTKGTGIYQHCGIGGWRATDFWEKPYRGSDTSDVNPFYNPNTKRFDLGYYLSQNGLDNPTHIILQLGINDVAASLKPDYAMQNVDSYVASMQGIVDNIKSYDDSIAVYVNLIIPPSTNWEHHDAYAAGYLSPQIMMWNDVQAIVALKKNLKNANGFLPINCIVDRDTDLADRVHPNNEGYEKIGRFLSNCMAAI